MKILSELVQSEPQCGFCRGGRIPTLALLFITAVRLGRFRARWHSRFRSVGVSTRPSRWTQLKWVRYVQPNLILLIAAEQGGRLALRFD